MPGARASVAGRLAGLRVESLLPAPALVLEALWIFPWLMFISQWKVLDWKDPPLGMGSVLAVLGVSYYATLWWAGGGKKGRGRGLRLLTFLGTLALIALLTGVEQGGREALFSSAWWDHVSELPQKTVSGLLFGAYLMWRGSSLGQGEITFQQLYSNFMVGIVALASLLVIWGAASRNEEVPSIGGSVGWQVAGFFVAGLAGLALTNYQAIQREARRMGQGAEGPNSRFVALAVGFTLVFVLVGLAIASIVSLNFVTFFIDPIATLADWLFTAFLFGIVLPLSWIIAGLALPILWLLRALRTDQEPVEFTPVQTDDLRDAAERGEAPGIPDWILAAGKWGLVAVGASIVLFFLVRAFMRRRDEDGGEAGEEISESLWVWSLFWTDVRGFLASLLAFFTSRFSPSRDAPAPLAARRGRESDRTLEVRELYKGLLWEGQASGRPRRPHETPFGYAARLERALPGEREQIQQITDEYVRHRYGHAAVPEERTMLLNRLWRRLRQALRGEEPPPG